MAKTDAKTPLPYRPCVGVVLLNSQGLVLVAQRIDAPGAWQMPQGGIDPGEAPQAAAFRELQEEIGTANAAIVHEHPDWITYDLPPDLVGRAWKGRYRGQTQRWFAMRFLGTDSEIDLDTAHPEFDAWKWVPMADLPALIVPFKRDAYRQVVAAFSHLVEL